MIVNLVPEFLAARSRPDRMAAYGDYVARHRTLLEHYWHNYVLDLDSPPASDVIAHAVQADRTDLQRLLANTDVERLAAEALDTAAHVLELDQELDLYLMVGVGAANAGELVVNGRGVVVIALEHFTGQANPETYGMGLDPSLLPVWIAHEVAHVVRYTSRDSRSDLRRMIAESGGVYDCWDLASRATLRELLLNEGVAVHAARAAAPGHAAEAYFGFSRRQYRRMRELESFLAAAVRADLDGAGLGLRLRYLTGGMTPSSRMVRGRVLPERSGYYLGWRMAEALVQDRGVAAAARASASEFAEADMQRAGGQALGA